MSQQQEPKNRKLSVYLIKKTYKDPAKFIKDNPDHFKVTSSGKEIGSLFIKQIPEKRPEWLSFLEGGISRPLNHVKSKNISAVLLLKRKSHTLAITFGYGKSMLLPETIEERFGLKVVLNSIDRDKVRIIDRKNLDTMSTQTRTQTGKICAIEEFNLDVQQILLKAVTGEPKDEEFAKNVSGSDGLSINYPATLENIERKCDELLDLFKSTDYQNEFPWVNNISELTSKSKKEELDEEIVSRLKNDRFDHLYLAIPDIVEWTNIDGFKFSERNDDVRNDILLSDFLDTIRDREQLSTPFLKRRHVFKQHSSTGYIEKAWAIYRCLNCEITEDGRTYILTDGKWYEIETDFVKQVNNQINNIKNYSRLLMPALKNQKEPDYCKSVAKSDESKFALMDRKIIHHGGGRSQIEFCDIFSSNKRIIHIKKYAGSSVLSHLFSQGVNSAKLFLGDLDFRKKVNNKLPNNHKIKPDEPVDAKEYEVVFGIISESAGTVPENLPFFSKLSLMRASQELSNIMRFKVAVTGIKVSDEE